MVKKPASPRRTKSFEDLYLANFQKNNPQSSLSIDENNLIIDKPWGYDDARLVFDTGSLGPIKDLNNCVLRSQFDAVVHLDKNMVEFMYGYLPPNDEPYKSQIDRTFEFILNGKLLKCSFAMPSERFMNLAAAFHRIPSESAETAVRQMPIFKQAQLTKKELSKSAQEFFAETVPRNFFVEWEESIDLDAIETAARHINFIADYYDRASPFIVIRSKPGEETADIPGYKRFLSDSFPSKINLPTLDEFMLQLLSSALFTSPRFAYVYYYQVLEYAGFHFVDAKAKRDLRQLLRDPQLISCSDDKISELFSLLTDVNQSDDVKIKKVIEEYCNPRVIWAEVENDREFFTHSVVFDGGVEVQALISKDTTEESWVTMWMPKLYDNLTRIRNLLVHARERRQSNVISPTAENDRKVRRYIPLIRRVAEQIAINKES